MNSPSQRGMTPSRTVPARRPGQSIMPVNGTDPSRPRFNNCYRSFDLVERGGQVLIRYRLPGGRRYPAHVLEALGVLREHPCPHIVRIHDIRPDAILAEYLPEHVPLGKVRVTSTQFRSIYLRAKHRGRFRRWRLLGDLRDVREHFDAFLSQWRGVGRYLREHGLWHDDLMPNNVMWRRADHTFRIVDIAAFVPYRLIVGGEHPLYILGRPRGVFRLDYSLDDEYLRDIFLQDLDPWPRVLIRKCTPRGRRRVQRYISRA